MDRKRIRKEASRSFRSLASFDFFATSLNPSQDRFNRKPDGIQMPLGARIGLEKFFYRQIFLPTTFIKG